MISQPLASPAPHDRVEDGRSPEGPPLVDVLIPAYNAENTVAEALASIQRQTVTRLRLLVVDDGSTDRTASILDGLARQDPRIVVLRQTNAGIVDALNSALAVASAAYIARHDADDIAYPTRLAQQIRFLDHNPTYAAVGANAWHIGKDGRRLGTRTVFRGDVEPDPFAVPAREPYLMHPFLVVRRDAMLRVGGYRHCFHAEDADLYWRLLAVGKLHNLSDVLGEYRVHAGSVSGVSPRNGRIAAKYSQLAALSHRRRMEGRPDLPFLRDDLAILNAAEDFAGVLSHGHERLDEAEVAYLRRASAAKLVDIACYRPFSLTIADCRQMASALQDLSDLPNLQRSIIRRSQAEVLRRYIDAGLWRQIQALRLSPSVFARLPRRYWWKFRNALRVRQALRQARAA